MENQIEEQTEWKPSYFPNNSVMVSYPTAQHEVYKHQCVTVAELRGEFVICKTSDNQCVTFHESELTILMPKFTAGMLDPAIPNSRSSFNPKSLKPLI